MHAGKNDDTKPKYEVAAIGKGIQGSFYYQPKPCTNIGEVPQNHHTFVWFPQCNLMTLGICDVTQTTSTTPQLQAHIKHTVLLSRLGPTDIYTS